MKKIFCFPHYIYVSNDGRAMLHKYTQLFTYIYTRSTRKGYGGNCLEKYINDGYNLQKEKKNIIITSFLVLNGHHPRLIAFERAVVQQSVDGTTYTHGTKRNVMKYNFTKIKKNVVVKEFFIPYI